MAREKNETIDCVELKRRAQERIQQAYESRSGEFSSFLDFIHAAAAESTWVTSLRARIGSKASAR